MLGEVNEHICHICGVVLARGGCACVAKEPSPLRFRTPEAERIREVKAGLTRSVRGSKIDIYVWALQQGQSHEEAMDFADEKYIPPR